MKHCPQPRASRFQHPDGASASPSSSSRRRPRRWKRRCGRRSRGWRRWRPSFVSVTYGAGGSTRERTHATVKRIIAETALAPAAHLTCVAATRAEVDEVVHSYVAAGVRHIVALRGDPVGGVGERYAPHPVGLWQRRRSRRRHQAFRRHRGLGVGLSGKASGQPVGGGRHRHAGRPRSMPARPGRSPSSSSIAITISAISTGSAPAASPSRSCPASCRCRTSSRCGCSPSAAALACRPGSPTASPASTPTRRRAKLIAAAVAAEQVLDLVDRGVTDFHFYTMNRADLVYAICHLLGVRAVPVELAA